MNVKSKVKGVLMGWVMVMVCVVTVAAQEKPADNMQIVLEKVRADKKLLVSENMQLTETEAKAFWPVYDQYQDELFLLRTRTLKLIKDYADAYEKMSNETAKKLLNELMSIETLGPKLRQTYLPKLRKVLPEVKVVRYYQIENKINAALMYELAANIPLMKAAPVMIRKKETKMRYFHLIAVLLVFVFAAGTLINPNPAQAATAAQINRDAKSALDKLYKKSPKAKTLGEKAKGILVFPGIVKGGFLAGGQFGEGALIKDGKTAGYYNTVQGSFGLQAGIQKYGYALFLMTDSAMKWIDKSDGWEIGVGPSIVVMDIGAASAATTTTVQSEIYAVFFDQKGLMGGLGLAGTKITKINK